MGGLPMHVPTIFHTKVPVVKPLFTLENKGFGIRHGLRWRETNNAGMLRLIVATVAAVSLLLWEPAYGRPGEATGTFAVSITILSRCTTKVDETSLEVSEYCNSPSPYRIFTVNVAPKIPAGNARSVTSDAANGIPHSLRNHPCDDRARCRVTVIYY